jgi:hypothetical protein
MLFLKTTVRVHNKIEHKKTLLRTVVLRRSITRISSFSHVQEPTDHIFHLFRNHTYEKPECPNFSHVQESKMPSLSRLRIKSLRAWTFKDREVHILMCSGTYGLLVKCSNSLTTDTHHIYHSDSDGH